MYAVTRRFFPVGKNFEALVVQRSHRSHTRTRVGAGIRIDAARIVQGTRVIAETTRAVWTPNRVANFPHNSEPSTMAPKNTIWCTAIPLARMKLGRSI